MKPSTVVVLIAPLVFGLPIPLSQDTSGLLSDKPTEGAWKLRSKRQWDDLSWYQIWGTTPPVDEQHWKNPPINPFDICETPEGKKLGAQCSGGSISEDTSDGYNTEHTDIHFTSWTIGPPDKIGWNPFAPPQTNRAVGTVGTSSVRTGTNAGGRTATGATGSTRPVNGGSTGISRDTTKDAKKLASGCLDLLGFASVGENC